jgi:hypothetical protein
LSASSLSASPGDSVTSTTASLASKDYAAGPAPFPVPR